MVLGEEVGGEVVRDSWEWREQENVSREWKGTFWQYKNSDSSDWLSVMEIV